MEVVGLFCVLTVGLLTRLIIVSRVNTSFDTYGHLYFALEVKRQNSGPFGKIKTKVIGSKSFRHPFLWHWIIGILSFDFFYTNRQWVNAVFDTLFIGLIFCLISVSYDPKTAFFVALLYIFTPILFSGISTGPRIKSLTPRITSEVAINLYFILVLTPIPIPEYISISLSILLGVYTLLSSKFGVQAIVLLSIFISIFLFSYKPILILLVSFFISIIVTRGMFLKTLKHQANHLIWYFKKNLKGEMIISNRNSFNLLKEKSKGKKGILKIGTIILQLIRRNSFGVVTFKLPALIAGISLFIYSNFFMGHVESIVPEIYVSVLAALVIYLMVNTSILLFIGEAERYLNHIIVFILLMTTILALDLNTSWILWVLIGYGVLYWLLEAFVYNTIIHKKLHRDKKEKEEKEIIDFLKSIKEEKTVLSFPYHAVGVWRIMIDTIHKTVFTYTTSEEFLNKLENKYASDYPYVNIEKLNEMDEDFGLDILIVDNKHVANRYDKMWTPPENWVKEPISGKIYTVYRNSHK